jgi:hypothetical protein
MLRTNRYKPANLPQSTAQPKTSLAKKAKGKRYCLIGRKESLTIKGVKGFSIGPTNDKL